MSKAQTARVVGNQKPDCSGFRQLLRMLQSSCDLDTCNSASATKQPGTDTWLPTALQECHAVAVDTTVISGTPGTPTQNRSMQPNCTGGRYCSVAACPLPPTQWASQSNNSSLFLTAAPQLV